MLRARQAHLVTERRTRTHDAGTITAIALAIAFNVVAGFNDGGNLLASAVSSRTIPPGLAFLIITLGALAGPLIVGTAVAHTIGSGIVDYRLVGHLPLSAGIAGGIVTLCLAYAARVPVSASVALISATIGSLLVTHQLSKLIWSGVAKVGLSLIGSIIVGFIAGALIYILALLALRNVNYSTGKRLMRLQYGSVLLQAIGYGANDAEKMMGLMVAATMISSTSSSFLVPWWAIAVSVSAFAVGMAVGGPRVAKTVGGKLFRIGPLHALSFQIAAAATVLGASAMGGPLSTTETTASAIMGVGAVENPRALRWQVARDLILAWLLTVPVGLLAGIALTILLGRLFQGVL
ncbi:MAG: inorganic phosphate transporter [Candidatus Eremiobacteraeota bacterium]|nr:inorganic phosphate transporter [Candidatus Eremiobacteraeota bacterium]